jgi:putative DNA primase/helicase
MKLIETAESGDWLPKARKVLTPEPDLLQYGMHDCGNSDRIIAVYGSDLRYCHEWKKWFRWDTQRWCLDTKADIRRKAKLVMVRFLRQAIETVNEGMEKFARQSLNAGRIEAGISLAQPELPIAPSELDQNAWLLNFQNCTLDLRTGEPHGHRREDFVTKLVPYDFDRDAQCPQWLTLLNKMMNANKTMIDYL